MANGKSKKVITRYRRIENPPFRSNSITLQEAITEAMHHEIGGFKIRDNYKLRERAELVQTTDTYVLANPEINDRFFFCELARFEKGANIPLCWGSPDSPGALIIGQQRPAEGREALLGVMQFLVVGNHVILIESGSLKTGRLEEYLTWLLKSKVGSIPSDSQLNLNTELELQSDDEEDFSEIKEISILPMPLKATEGRSTESGITGRIDSRDFTKPEVARNILSILGNTEAEIDSFLSEVPSGGDVELRLSLYFKKGRNRGGANPTTASARNLFRNIENEDIALKNSSGKVVGRMVALSREAQVKLNGSIIDYQDAVRTLWESYEHWIESGKIEP